MSPRLLLPLLFLALVVPAWAAASIEGGRGVGRVRLGQTPQELQKALGKPASKKPSPNDPQAFLYDYRGSGLSVLVGSSGRVIGITVTSSRYQTPEGLRVGSTRAQVEAAYGRGLQRGSGNVVYASRGVGFSYRQGRVGSIYVFKVEKGHALLGDRLIVPRQRVGGIYLGDALDKVTEAWGEPAAVGSLPQSTSWKLYDYPQYGVMVLAEGNIIQGLVLTTGDYITLEGVKVGSSRDDVVRAFGKASEESQGLMRYPQKALGFVLTAGRVSRIQVLREDKL
ncbi:MAG TPA: hypothetical protein VNO81_06205 [Candidatus Nitrosotenuis sp.]|nr:hypothetical protein [Candidatus Nitrosotenuis sp.]